MAIYHLSVKPISRSGGRSATAASAYRAAKRVHDEATGQTFDYTRKRGVEHSEIVLPTAAAKQDINWARDRQQLWNAAESAEKRKDARVAREYEVALPHELSKAQRIELLQGFCGELANRYGVAVDFAIHKPHRAGDERNYHAHVLTTTREIRPTGLGPKTDIELGDRDRAKKGLRPAKEEILEIRARWALLTNEYLQAHGIEARIDHRTLAAQGIEREPTQHLGPSITGMQRRGLETQVGQRLEHEAREAAQQRLARAQQLGVIEREGREIERSILDLSGDLREARRERDWALSKAQAGASRGPQSLEQLARSGREQWLKMREAQRPRQPSAGQSPPELQTSPAAEPSRSIEQIQKDAREQWLKMREAQQPGPEAQREQTPEQEREQRSQRWLEYRKTHILGQGHSLETDQGSKENSQELQPGGPALEGPEPE